MIINNIKEKLEKILSENDTDTKIEMIKDLNKILKTTSDDSIMNELKKEVSLLLDGVTDTINISIVRVNKSNGVKYIYLPRNINIKDGEACVIKKLRGNKNERNIIQNNEKSKS